VELLTVIAIIAVLATLISATLVNAQRKGRKALSTSNLRQIALAFNIYQDDHQRRPVTFRQMVDGKYLTERVLLCPEDRIVKNWAGLLEQTDQGRVSAPSAPRDPLDTDGPVSVVVGSDVPHSYFKSFDYVEDIWQNINRAALGGIAACQLHGLGRQVKDKYPSIQDFQGLVLRALKDGSVITRQVFWTESPFNSHPPGASGMDGNGTNSFNSSSQLPLFLDPAQ
jgi:type II secretory pathway pseudopilin PulG